MALSRKQFLQNVAWGTGGLAVMGNFGLMGAPVFAGNTVKAIVVDFDKCAGCRTCESVCSAWNNKYVIDEQQLDGLGNPSTSNIKVWRYNPPVDVPVTCFLCHDAPCVDACPVEPDAETGRKALYRDEKNRTILCDHTRCIGCESCASTCSTDRGGVIFPDENGHPRQMCTLCDGAPSCVKWCPYEALHFLEITASMELRRQTPEQIATQLIERFYELKMSAI
jgi:anaerobic carbon-monoxide dehydrogenase iron sulfur subunit